MPIHVQGVQLTPEPTNFSAKQKTLDPKTEQAIAKALIFMELKDRAQKTIRTHNYHLITIAQNCDIFNTTEVMLFILNMKRKPNPHSRVHPDTPLSKGYIKRFRDDYASFCEANQIPFKKQRIDYQPPIPLIPTTDQVNAIISTAGKDNAFLFTLLSETAIEPEELHRINLTEINKDEGIITVKGTKGHANGSYKLTSGATEMMRSYLAKHANEPFPFPKPKTLAENWRNTRNTAAQKLCKPDLDTIPLKNLRNYAGAQCWIHGKGTGFPPKDAIAVMRFMRHKKLETTQHYIQNINLNEPEEYKTEIVQLGQDNTLKRIKELSDAGYQRFTEADGYQIFRIRK